MNAEHFGNFRLAAAGVGAKSKLMLMPAAWPPCVVELLRRMTQARARLCNAAASGSKLSSVVPLLQGAFDTACSKENLKPREIRRKVRREKRRQQVQQQEQQQQPVRK